MLKYAVAVFDKEEHKQSIKLVDGKDGNEAVLKAVLEVIGELSGPEKDLNDIRKDVVLIMQSNDDIEEKLERLNYGWEFVISFTPIID